MSIYVAKQKLHLKFNAEVSYFLLDVSNHLCLHHYNTAQLYPLSGFHLCLLSRAAGLRVAQQKVRQAEERTPAYNGIFKFSCPTSLFLYSIFSECSTRRFFCYLQKLSCRGGIAILFVCPAGREKSRSGFF